MTIRFPEDERKLGWLAMLLDAYDIVDAAVGQVLDRDRRERGLELACAKGCCHCCREHPIPVTSLELSGLAWFILHKMNPEPGSRVIAAIRGFSGQAGCPLVLDNSCSVYPLRPLACRHFNVYTTACRAGEKVTEERPGQVMTPDKEAAQRAYLAMLPYYGFTASKEKAAALAENYLFKHSTLLHKVQWQAFL